MSAARQYTTKPITVEAIQWREDMANTQDVLEFGHPRVIRMDKLTILVDSTYDITPGDWLVKKLGKFYGYSDERFHAQFE